VYFLKLIERSPTHWSRENQLELKEVITLWLKQLAAGPVWDAALVGAEEVGGAGWEDHSLPVLAELACARAAITKFLTKLGFPVTSKNARSVAQ